MRKEVGDLTLREISEMKCAWYQCEKCPFHNFDEDYIADRLCEIVGKKDENHLFEQEVEVENDE